MAEEKTKRMLKEWVAEPEVFKMFGKLQAKKPSLSMVSVVIGFKEKATKQGGMIVPCQVKLVNDRTNMLLYWATNEAMDEEADRKVDFVVIIGRDYWDKCNAIGKEQILFHALCSMAYDPEDGPSINPVEFAGFKEEIIKYGLDTEPFQILKGAIQMKFGFALEEQEQDDKVTRMPKSKKAKPVIVEM